MTFVIKCQNICIISHELLQICVLVSSLCKMSCELRELKRKAAAALFLVLIEDEEKEMMRKENVVSGLFHG